MGDLITKENERDNFKQPATLDEALEAKLAPVIDAVNEHCAKMYQDFNMSMFKAGQRIDGLEVGIQHSEASVSRMVQVLWGVVNQANARTSALERVLIANGLSSEQLEEEILKVQSELEATGEWSQVPLEEIAGAMTDSTQP